MFFICRVIEEFESMLEKDIATNKKIGQFGGDDILARNSGSKVRILTHCNTGSLATAGYGTALGRFVVCILLAMCLIY